jgi:hypothetical protein
MRTDREADQTPKHFGLRLPDASLYPKNGFSFRIPPPVYLALDGDASTMIFDGSVSRSKPHAGAFSGFFLRLTALEAIPAAVKPQYRPPDFSRPGNPRGPMRPPRRPYSLPCQFDSTAPWFFP